ncbi:cation diffusion facilitator family transporter [Stakelama sp. CBK3Z-3]|uniref:Cation diffusion facilitator family transporter n=1 Tax=Stakelama flava TaxID=2860338 RepID=A0ABS6XIT0_9SPHN|nr:cation diffusion facilitator family transporter [Stakelama flava]MBW4329809.1 cation diffusion facilitator family transporter [Stakelama flava]
MSANHSHGHSHGHAHHHGHDHNHALGHAHAHVPADFGRAFAIGAILNIGFVVVEGGAGLIWGSMALLADAGHNLSDVLGLLIAWAGAELTKRPPSKRFTYGLRGSSILAALGNTLLLMIAVGAILLETIQRLADPPPVAGGMVMIVAAVGIVINGVTAWLFASGRKGDVNIRGAFVHMAADAMVSAGVVIGGALILWTGAAWIDPVVSLIIVAVIVWSSWGLFRTSIGMALQAVPPGIDHDAVMETLHMLPGVAHIHDLHIWPMSTTESALTAHLYMPAGHPGDAFLIALQERLLHDFGIDHITIQIEVSENAGCRMHGEQTV